MFKWELQKSSKDSFEHLVKFKACWCPWPGPEPDGTASGGAVMAPLGSFSGNWPLLFSAIPLLVTCMAPQPSCEKGLDLILIPFTRGGCLCKGPAGTPKLTDGQIDL